MIKGEQASEPDPLPTDLRSGIETKTLMACCGPDDRSGRTLSRTIVQVLAENRGDVMSLGMFTHYILSFDRLSGVDLRSSVLGHLETIFTEGLMVVGSLGNNRHEPWDCTDGEALERISGQWPTEATMNFGALQSLGWLVNTVKGDRTAVGTRRC